MRRLVTFVALLVLSLLVIPVASAQDATPDASSGNLSGACMTASPEETAAVAEAYLDVWNSKDVSLFDTLATPDIVHHWGQGVDTVGIDSLKASSEAFFAAFPDMVMTFDDTIVEGDMVVIRWTLNGTQTGQFFQIAPTNLEATWTGINIYRISCGQVVESWSEADGVGLRAQLLPSPELATPAP